MPGIFLSHSSKDKAFARKLAGDLQAAGVCVWIDEAELLPGVPLMSSLGRAIDQIDFLGVILSPSAVASPWVSMEMEIAMTTELESRSVKVVPLLLVDCDIPSFLRPKLRCDFRSERCYNDSLRLLLRALGISDGDALSRRLIFDDSYRQSEWYGQPVAEAGYRKIAASTGGKYVVGTRTEGYQSMTDIATGSVLVLPSPFGTLVDDAEFAEISRWVNRGGRLLLLGIYLNDLHHYNNFNNLARRFGFEFSHDLIMPPGRESTGECIGQAFPCDADEYWVQATPTSTPTDCTILQGVDQLLLTSCSTVESARPPAFKLSTQERFPIMHARGFKNPEGRMAQITEYVRNRNTNADFALGIEYGSGKVVAIGSWKTFVNSLLRSNVGNQTFFHNTIRWMEDD